MSTIGSNAFTHLQSELSCRHEYQGPNRAKVHPRYRVFHQALEHRQGKACGLSGTGLSSREQIFTRKYARYSLSLYRGGGGIALLAYREQQIGPEAK